MYILLPLVYLPVLYKCFSPLSSSSSGLLWALECWWCPVSNQEEIWNLWAVSEGLPAVWQIVLDCLCCMLRWLSVHVPAPILHVHVHGCTGYPYPPQLPATTSAAYFFASLGVLCGMISGFGTFSSRGCTLRHMHGSSWPAQLAA